MAHSLCDIGDIGLLSDLFEIGGFWVEADFQSTGQSKICLVNLESEN